MLATIDLSNRFLSAAVQDLPGYRQALDVAEQARQALAALPAVPPVSVPGPLDSGKLTGKWLDAQLDHDAQAARHAQRRALLAAVAADARDSAARIVAGSTDEILVELHDSLTRLLDDARGLVQQLGGATTPAEAIAADAGPAWRALGELAEQYQILRAGQDVVMSHGALQHWTQATATRGEAHANDAYLRNLDKIWANWRTPTSGLQVVRLDGGRHRPEPWPTDPTAMLAWLVTSDAEPWVPTRAQLDELWADRSERANPNPRKIRPSSALNRPLSAPARVAMPIEIIHA